MYVNQNIEIKGDNYENDCVSFKHMSQNCGLYHRPECDEHEYFLSLGDGVVLRIEDDCIFSTHASSWKGKQFELLSESINKITIEY